MSDSEKDASKWIEQLGLLTHPEGGYFREVYRSEEGIAQRALPARYGSGRNFGTSIYYMLKGNDFSAFHKLHSDEIWHFYEGCTVRIFLLTEDGSCKKLLLGRNVEVGEQLQVLLPHDLWFAAELADTESFALMGCTVSPGFSFEDFMLGSKADLIKQYPQHSTLIQRLSRD